MLRVLLALSAALVLAPEAEAQLFRKGDRVNVRVRARFAPRDYGLIQPAFYQPAYGGWGGDYERFSYERSRPYFQPSYFAPRDRFSLDLRLRSGGGCVGPWCR